MNGRKRLMAALLALAMMGQLGTVVGMADNGDLCKTTSTSADHGMILHDVTDVRGCENEMHWISSSNGVISIRGGGTNYFYPKAADKMIICGGANDGANDIIIFESKESIPNQSESEQLTINYFSPGDGDKILVPETITASVTENGNLEIGGRTILLVPPLVSSGLGKTTVIRPLPTGALSILLDKDGSGNVTITANPPKDKNDGPYTYEGGYTYLWGTKEGGSQVYTKVEKIETTPSPSTAEPTVTTKAPSPGTYCIVVENDSGRFFESDPLPEDPSCSATPHITVTCKKDGKQVDLAGHPLLLFGDSGAEKEYTLGIAFSDPDSVCTIGDHAKENHGYTVSSWTVSGSDGVVVSDGTGTMTVTGNKLKAEQEEITLTAMVNKNGSPEPEALTAKFNARKLAIEKGSKNTSPNPQEIAYKTDNDSPTEYAYTTNISGLYDFTWKLEPREGSASEDTSYIGVTDEKKATAKVTVYPENLPATAATKKPFVLTVELKPDPNATLQTSQARGLAAFAALPLSAAAGSPILADDPISASFEIAVSVDAKPADAPDVNCAMTPNTVEITNAPDSISITDLAKPYTVDLSKNVKVGWEGGGCNMKDHTPTSHGETVKWSIADPATPGAATLKWAEIDAGKLTLYGDKLPAVKNTLQVKVTVAANNKETSSPPVTITVERPEIAVTGPAGSATPNEINVDNDPAPKVSYTYTAAVFDSSTTSYNYSWSLAKKNSQQSLPKYIDFSSKGNQATITVIKAELPANGVDEAYELTVTATPENDPQTNALAKAIAALTAVTTGENTSLTKTLTYDIRVRSAVRSGGSSSSEADYSGWYQWQDIRREINRAKKGSTVKASLKDNTNLPYYILDDLRGEDISLKMTISGGYTWTVNGRSVQRTPQNLVWILMGVKNYSDSKMTALCRESKIKSFQLENTGSFYSDMRLTMNLGGGYAKKTVYLYSYDKRNNKLTYSSSAKVADNGDVDFVFARSLGAYVVTSKALYGESAVGAGGGTVGSGNKPTVVYPPVVSLPASQAPAPSSSTESGPGSESAPPSMESAPDPVPDPDPTPVDTIVEPEPENAPVPFIVPLLILAIAGVITATVVVINNSRNKNDFDIG